MTLPSHDSHDQLSTHSIRKLRRGLWRTLSGADHGRPCAPCICMQNSQPATATNRCCMGPANFSRLSSSTFTVGQPISQFSAYAAGPWEIYSVHIHHASQMGSVYTDGKFLAGVADDAIAQGAMLVHLGYMLTGVLTGVPWADFRVTPPHVSIVAPLLTLVKKYRRPPSCRLSPSTTTRRLTNRVCNTRRSLASSRL